MISTWADVTAILNNAGAVPAREANQDPARQHPC